MDLSQEALLEAIGQGISDVLDDLVVIEARRVKWQGRSFHLGGYYESREAHIKSLIVAIRYLQNRVEVLVNLDNGERICFHVYNAPVEVESLENEI